MLCASTPPAVEADHPSAAGAVRHKVKGDRDGEFAYVRDACVERALTCRSRSVLPRMLTRTCFALPGRLQEHPNDYSDQLLHPVARLGAQGAALKAVFKERDRVRWTPPISWPPLDHSPFGPTVGLGCEHKHKKPPL